MRARLSVPVQTGPDAHTLTVAGVKQQGRGADHPSPSSVQVTSGLELYLRLPSVPASAHRRGGFTYIHIRSCFMTALYVM